jgi:SAM-dependent methyltransferase
VNVHDSAARGYERGAGDYEKGRPGYPPEVVGTLARECGLGEASRVVDVGAGTGKFTRELFRLTRHVTAVEPVAAMRSVYAANFPGAPVLEGTAEHLPVEDGSADLVVVAQAFHWFDHGPALDEMARVLRPGGWLALVWNTRDDPAPWSRRLVALMDELAGEAAAPRFRSGQGTWRATLEGHAAFDGEVRSAEFENLVPFDLPTVLARVGSTSYVSALPDDRRAEVLAEVEALVPPGDFVERYRTELFWCRRR